MSIKLMSQVWDLALPHPEKWVLMALCDFANDEGYCYPGTDRLAEKTDYSGRQITRIKESLKSVGCLQVIEETTSRRQTELLRVMPWKGPRKRAAQSVDKMSTVPRSVDTAMSENGGHAERESRAPYQFTEPSVNHHRKSPSDSEPSKVQKLNGKGKVRNRLQEAIGARLPEWSDDRRKFLELLEGPEEPRSVATDEVIQGHATKMRELRGVLETPE